MMTDQNHDIMIMISLMMMYHDFRDSASAQLELHHRNPQRGFQISNIMISDQNHDIMIMIS